MTLIWLGVILVFGGVLQMEFQPIWRSRLSGRTRLRSRPSDTLEPERPAGGFGIKTNWPGLALVALGAAMYRPGDLKPRWQRLWNATTGQLLSP